MQTELSTAQWLAVVLITLLSLGGTYKLFQWAGGWWKQRIAEWDAEEATKNLNERALIGAARSAANNSNDAVTRLNILQGSVIESAQQGARAMNGIAKQLGDQRPWLVSLQATVAEMVRFQNAANEEQHSIQCLLGDVYVDVSRLKPQISNLSDGTLTNILAINKRLTCIEQSAQRIEYYQRHLDETIVGKIKQAIRGYDAEESAKEQG